MAQIPIVNLKGINTYVTPFDSSEPARIIHCVNLDSEPLGAKKKRPGYTTYLGTPDTSQVNSLFSWTKNDGTTLFNYRASGTKLYHSLQGTGAWTTCGNGTIASGAHVQHTVMDNTLMICDGAGSTRYSTTGTSFTDTTLAPVAVDLQEYQGRVYAAGTVSHNFYSTSGTPTDWSTDSSSILIPGAGKLSRLFKASDRLLSCKNSGIMTRWDGVSLVDMATDLGPSSPYSVAEVEDFRFFLNRLGVFMTNAGPPQLISNSIQRQIYNDAGSGIAGTTFNTAPGEVHKYNYYLSVGTITDDFVGEQISDAIIKYDYQKNEFLNYKFANFPTAWHSYKDVNGVQQLIFGDASGQCYTYGGTVTSDNGTTIEASMILLFHGGSLDDKKFKWFMAAFNPGCQAKIAVATTDTFIKGAKRWIDLGDVDSGVLDVRFPPEVSRGKLLWIKIYEASQNARFNLYSMSIDYDYIPK